MKNIIGCLLGMLLFVFGNAQTPVYDWTKQISQGGGNLFILSSVVDAAGNLYCTGVLTGTVDVDPGPGTFNLTDVGFGDLIITKLDSSGALLWAKQIGRDSYDQGSSIALDAAGNVYVSGFFSVDSTDFDPGPAISYLFNPNNGAQSFILKLDASGDFVWAKSFGPFSNSARSIILDAADHILVTGVFGDSIDFDPGPGIAKMFNATGNGIYLVKLNDAGEFIWHKQIDPGTTSTQINSVGCDGAQSIYLTGMHYGTVDFDPGPGVSNLSVAGIFGGEFIMKLDSSGNFRWAKAIDGSIAEAGGDRAIRVDQDGSVYTAGWFGNTLDCDPDAGVFNLTNTSSTGSSTYLLKLDSAGSFKWARQIADAADGNNRAITLDHLHHIYIAGNMISNGEFGTVVGSHVLPISNGSTFVACYEEGGNLVWALNFSNDTLSSDHSVSLNVDARGNVYTTGVFAGTGDFDPSPGIAMFTAASMEDIFIQKINNQAFLSAKDLNRTSSSWNVFPNPAQESFSIQSDERNTFLLITESGDLLRAYSLNECSQVSVSTSGLAEGIYILIPSYKPIGDGRLLLIQK